MSQSTQDRKLTAAVVGVRGMGRSQARILKNHPDFELVAVCDLVEENARAAAEENGVPFHLDFAEMLATRKPEVVAVCTHNASHAKLTIAAAQAGVRGVYCEKPMAVSLGEARAMVEACRQAGAVLVINHQRRINPDLVAARALIESGAIGEVVALRGACAGDFLSDGTHIVDSLMWLAGDVVPLWALAQIHREAEAEQAEYDPALTQGKKPGFRFGHPVEDGGIALIQLPKEVRVEFSFGAMRGRTAYQDYEVFGTRGRIWRVGDQLSPNLFVQDAKGGEWEAEFGQNWHLSPVKLPAGERGQWRAVELPPAAKSDYGIPQGFSLFANSIRNGTVSPMNGDVALRNFEIVMAVYESARIRGRVTFPLQQERFPLELMLAENSHHPSTSQCR